VDDADRLEHRRKLGRKRQRRHYYRKKRSECVGRFLDFAELQHALELTGLMRVNESVETGVARLHKVLSDNPLAFVEVISDALESGR
jgi:hypothetical protein